jgi:hypothetical protein
VEVMHMLKPPQTLLRPDIVARALAPAGRGGAGRSSRYPAGA